MAAGSDALPGPSPARAKPAATSTGGPAATAGTAARFAVSLPAPGRGRRPADAIVPSNLFLRRLIAIVLPALWLWCPRVGLADGGGADLPGSGGRNAPAHLDTPSVVLVSLDGFRHDYRDRYPTPTLDAIARRGVRAERLVPPFPSLTFASHYSIATGLTPGRHGIVGNRFLDPASGRHYSLRDRATVEDGWWYGGEPVWVTAETQGMVSAAFYFVGTEADVGGVRPTHWRRFDVSVPGEVRVDQVLAWLAEPAAVRPRFITLYLGLVDRAGHDHGPDAPATGAAVVAADALLGRLLAGIEGLPGGAPVYVVVVSDHGMLEYRRDVPPFVLDDVVDTAGIRSAVGGPVLYLYLDDPARAPAIRDAVNAAWEHGRAWLSAETPAAWGVASNPRFGDVILVADPGYAVLPRALRGASLPVGAHGWAPSADAMGGIFLATGPGLPAGHVLPPVRAVDIYPFLVRLLGLEPPADLDASPAGLADRIALTARAAPPAGDAPAERPAPPVSAAP